MRLGEVVWVTLLYACMQQSSNNQFQIREIILPHSIVDQSVNSVLMIDVVCLWTVLAFC